MKVQYSRNAFDGLRSSVSWFVSAVKKQVSPLDKLDETPGSLRLSREEKNESGLLREAAVRSNLFAGISNIEKRPVVPGLRGGLDLVQLMQDLVETGQGCERNESFSADQFA